MAGRQNGQALVEFALISVILALLLTGAIEFGFLFGHKIELAGAARAGARWAASHPSSWTATATPASTTVEGQIRYAGGTQQVPNDDAHMAIEYFAVNGATVTPCGRFSAASNAFVPVAGYSQTTCVADGNLVRVTVQNSYPIVSALIARVTGPEVALQAAASMVMIG